MLASNCIKEALFFLFVSEVFMSDSPDYCYVEKCFSGPASVLILPLCDEKKSFCHAWAMYVGLDPGFNNFRTCYAHVPKQANQCNMLEVFSQEDIPNIRVQIVNDLLFSKHNTADVNIVKNFNANVLSC